MVACRHADARGPQIAAALLLGDISRYADLSKLSQLPAQLLPAATPDAGCGSCLTVQVIGVIRQASQSGGSWQPRPALRLVAR